MEGPRMHGVPVVPNASLVTGTVQSLQTPAQEQPDPVLGVLVRRAENVGSLPNFCAEEVGNTIHVTIRGEAEAPLPVPYQRVRLRVEFRGNEWGGSYYTHTHDLERVDEHIDDEDEDDDD